MADSSVAERLRMALEMYEVGERIQRQRLRRQNPKATDADIDAQVTAWRLRRPGAANGDAAGRPSRRFG